LHQRQKLFRDQYRIFHLVPTSISEEKQSCRKNIHPKFHLYDSGQAINRLSEVHVILVEKTWLTS
jgi:hypothetical protein